MQKRTKEILDHLETGIRQALRDEVEFSKENGFANGHYWLHRKIHQILDEMRDHYEVDAWTPHFTCDDDYVRGMCQAYNEVIDLLPEHVKEIRKYARSSQSGEFLRLMDRRRQNECIEHDPWPMHGGSVK